MTAQTIYYSYFYVIRDKETDELYAGCRYADGCSPDEFWKTWGYQTSSEVVKERVKEFGLERFEVVKLKPFLNKFDAPLYEKRFLKKVRAPFNPRFLNENYGGYCKATPKSQEKRLESQGNSFEEKYGVRKVSHVPGVVEKREATKKKVMLEKYGVENISQTEYFKTLKKQNAKNLFEREIVMKIKELNKVVKKKLSQGWWQKSEESLNELYEELLKERVRVHGL